MDGWGFAIWTEKECMVFFRSVSAQSKSLAVFVTIVGISSLSKVKWRMEMEMRQIRLVT